VIGLARRTLALLLIALVVIETAGLAQAFGIDAMVHCCCGPHTAARKCRCLSCPVTRRHKREDVGSRIATGGDCHNDQTSNDGRLIPLSDPLIRAPQAEPDFVGFVSEFPIAQLRGRSRDVARPPP
jgi:hypothetical protein